MLRIGRGRSTRYAATCDVFDAGRTVPLLNVGEEGVVHQVATLRALTSGHYLVEAQEAPRWLRGEAGSGLFDSLPYFLHDLRPAGFVGRRVARQLADTQGFPRDPRDWGDAQIGRYLLQHGDDLPGNLVVGEAAAVRVSQRAGTTNLVQTSDYPELARRALGHELVGSPAAGEQRVYLECRRFDRVGARGRLPAVSMTMVDAEFVGEGRGWTRTAKGLQRVGLLDCGSLEQIAWLEAFGAWIGNNDMHLGNLSLAPHGDGFRLLPLYDMLPMALAPVHGELPDVTLQPPVRTALNEEVWAPAGAAAAGYWLDLAREERLSDGFCALARSYAERWRGVLGL